MPKERRGGGKGEKIGILAPSRFACVSPLERKEEFHLGKRSMKGKGGGKKKRKGWERTGTTNIILIHAAQEEVHDDAGGTRGGRKKKRGVLCYHASRLASGGREESRLRLFWMPGRPEKGNKKGGKNAYRQLRLFLLSRHTLK